MTTTRTALCGHCEQRTTARGYTLCPDCRDTLTRTLANVVALHTDLQTNVRTRRTRFGDGSTRSHDSNPLPVDVRFTPSWTTDDHGTITGPLRAGRGDALDVETAQTLGRWSAWLTTTWPPLPPRRPVVDLTKPDTDARRRQDATAIRYDHDVAVYAPPARPTVTHRAAHIRRLVPRLLHHDRGPQLLAALVRLEQRLAAAVDRPTDRWPLGTCGLNIEPERPHNVTTCACRCHHGARYSCDIEGGCHPEQTTIPAIRCTQQLYAQERDQTFVTCKTCGTTWPVAYRREVLLDEAHEESATVADLARILTTLEDRDGQTARLSSRIRRWVSLGELKPVGSRKVLGRPRELFRVSDVRRLLAQNDHRSPVTGVSRTR